MLRRISVVALSAALLLAGYLIGGVGPALPAVAQQPTEECYQETGKCVRGPFLTYFRTNGGVAQQGFPISNEFDEKQQPPPAGDGQVHTVQYFQRARFELHNEGSRQVVKLGLLGAEQYQARYQTPPPQEPIAFQGNGTLRTRLFTLHGGHYTSRWTVTEPFSRSSIGCSFNAQLAKETEDYGEDVGSGRSPVNGTVSGETQVYNVDQGRYYLAISARSECQWSITLSPQQ